MIWTSTAKDKESVCVCVCVCVCVRERERDYNMYICDALPRKVHKVAGSEGATRLNKLCDPILSILSLSTFQSLWPLIHLY